METILRPISHEDHPHPRFLIALWGREREAAI